MARSLVALVVAACAALLAPASAEACHPVRPGGFTKADVRIRMDDGVALAATLYRPEDRIACDHTIPPTPAIVVLHGLGGTRGSLTALTETAFASRGFIVVAYDARGHGESGGLSSLAGAREVADLRAVVGWLAARRDVRDDAIGAFGISYGGGQVLRALVEGVPLAAAVVAETWSDLYGALLPQDLAKSGAVLGFLSAVARRATPDVLAIGPSAIASRNLAAVRAFAAARSSRTGLGVVRTPVLVLQGRRDFVFDLQQGLELYRRLGGPKRLYVGPFGHTPSRFPGPDIQRVVDETTAWFRRFAARAPGPFLPGSVVVAPDPYVAARARAYDGPPPTRSVVLRASGRNRIGGAGSFTRELGRTGTLLETFGSPVVRVRASGSFGRVVAVLRARLPNGRSVVVSEGGANVRLSATPRDVAVRLAGQATTVPRGSRLSLRVGATSGDVLYVAPERPTARLTVTTMRVSVPVLRSPVSRP